VVIFRACQLAAALVRALPPGSAGKWWALDQGLRAARGDLVLFLDADNLPRPGSPAACSLDRTCHPPENP
jgi:cellulose synthase/poly-beta-1,6-N-acetylglucosamine synthase-like glycosyltransferase